MMEQLQLDQKGMRCCGSCAHARSHGQPRTLQRHQDREQQLQSGVATVVQQATGGLMSMQRSLRGRVCLLLKGLHDASAADTTASVAQAAEGQLLGRCPDVSLLQLLLSAPDQEPVLGVLTELMLHSGSWN